MVRHAGNHLAADQLQRAGKVRQGEYNGEVVAQPVHQQAHHVGGHKEYLTGGGAPIVGLASCCYRHIAKHERGATHMNQVAGSADKCAALRTGDIQDLGHKNTQKSALGRRLFGP